MQRALLMLAAEALMVGVRERANLLLDPLPKQQQTGGGHGLAVQCQAQPTHDAVEHSQLVHANLDMLLGDSLGQKPTVVVWRLGLVWLRNCTPW